MGVKSTDSDSTYYGIFDTTAPGGTDAPLAYLPPPVPFSATGGTTYEPGNGYKYHVFTSSGSFVGSGDPSNVEVLIVAGGGGSTGEYGSGGGGGGGVVHVTSYSIGAGSHPVTVGSGGAATTPNSAPTGDGSGGDSVFQSITALGGGSKDPSKPTPKYVQGGDGGSGAGGGGNGLQPGRSQPIPNSNYNQYGGDGGDGSDSSGSAGGGGAGGNGQDPGNPGPGNGGPGGNGVAIPGFEYPLIGLSPLDPYSPTNNQYGGGGGGWGYDPMPYPNGGQGGGGTGVSYPGNTHTAGVNHLGGGAGSFVTPNPENQNLAGGSGIIVVRYLV